jgi:N-acetylglucosamine kinase-like BadF-type ATPase
MKIKLIAESGSTKADWCLVAGNETWHFKTQGISPYFLNEQQIQELLEKELVPNLPPEIEIEEINYYGTGCLQPKSVKIVETALKAVFPLAVANVKHDLMGAARSLCGNEPGVVSILGTGANSCYYDGKEVAKNNPGLGFILGDEASGAYLGKKLLRMYMYNSFDEELKARFDAQYNTNNDEILENVYRKPMANRYLAGFAPFLSENRGHYLIENILEDSLNEFFFNHIYKYSESWTLPLHFTGSIAWHFKDVLQELCDLYELQLGKILRSPMEGLIAYHK